jgi:hypothetical protein
MRASSSGKLFADTSKVSVTMSLLIMPPTVASG